MRNFSYDPEEAESQKFPAGYEDDSEGDYVDDDDIDDDYLEDEGLDIDDEDDDSLLGDTSYPSEWDDYDEFYDDEGREDDMDDDESDGDWGDDDEDEFSEFEFEDDPDATGLLGSPLEYYSPSDVEDQGLVVLDEDEVFRFVDGRGAILHESDVDDPSYDEESVEDFDDDDDLTGKPKRSRAERRRRQIARRKRRRLKKHEAKGRRKKRVLKARTGKKPDHKPKNERKKMTIRAKRRARRARRLLKSRRRLAILEKTGLRSGGKKYYSRADRADRRARRRAEKVKLAAADVAKATGARKAEMEERLARLKLKNSRHVDREKQTQARIDKRYAEAEREVKMADEAKKEREAVREKKEKSRTVRTENGQRKIPVPVPSHGNVVISDGVRTTPSSLIKSVTPTADLPEVAEGQVLNMPTRPPVGLQIKPASKVELPMPAAEITIRPSPPPRAKEDVIQAIPIVPAIKVNKQDPLAIAVQTQTPVSAAERTTEAVTAKQQETIKEGGIPPFAAVRLINIISQNADIVRSPIQGRNIAFIAHSILGSAALRTIGQTTSITKGGSVASGSSLAFSGSDIDSEGTDDGGMFDSIFLTLATSELSHIDDAIFSFTVTAPLIGSGASAASLGPISLRLKEGNRVAVRIIPWVEINGRAYPTPLYMTDETDATINARSSNVIKTTIHDAPSNTQVTMMLEGRHSLTQTSLEGAVTQGVDA